MVRRLSRLPRSCKSRLPTKSEKIVGPFEMSFCKWIPFYTSESQPLLRDNTCFLRVCQVLPNIKNQTLLLLSIKSFMKPQILRNLQVLRDLYEMWWNTAPHRGCSPLLLTHTNLLDGFTFLRILQIFFCIREQENKLIFAANTVSSQCLICS